jgi:hypothetical protein
MKTIQATKYEKAEISKIQNPQKYAIIFFVFINMFLEIFEGVCP